MEQRTLGGTGLKVGAVGLGTEHLEHSRANMEEVVRVAVEARVNYLDVLYEDPDGASGFWGSFAPAVKPYRDKLVLAAHWGPSYHDDLEKGRRCFEEVLARLGGHAEVAIIAVIDEEEHWDGWGQRSVEVLSRYREEGRIGHIGMSGHFTWTAMKAVESGAVDVLMFPINMLKHDDEETKRLCRACSERGIGLVAMKPYFGGTLFRVGGKPTGITPTQCLAYVLSQPVSTTVPGVKNAKELRTTLRYLDASEEERDFRQAIANLPVYFEGVCTYCRHCLPCPHDIRIPEMTLLLDFAQGGVTDELRQWYRGFKVKASACAECGTCMERCPFKVDVIAKMKRAVELFEGGA
jgi:predicted aldo/keto reductase-like oxidoreductase